MLKLITMQGFTFNLQHYLGFWRSSSKGDQKDLVTILKSHHYPITNIEHSSNSRKSQNITYKIKDNKSQKRFQSSNGRITKGFFFVCVKRCKMMVYMTPSSIWWTKYKTRHIQVWTTPNGKRIYKVINMNAMYDPDYLPQQKIRSS